MTHETFTEMISAWLDNELSPAEVSQVQAHLAGCPACRHVYQAMRQVDTLLHSAAGVSVAPLPGFSQRFETRLAEAGRRRPWHLWLALGALALGTLTVLAIVAAVAGITLLAAGPGLLDAGLFFRGLADLIEWAEAGQALISMAGLILKVSLLTMSQPLFWVCLAGAIAVSWLWFRGLGNISRRLPAAGELLI